jgi:ABC-type multidrug transport system permease subunit
MFKALKIVKNLNFFALLGIVVFVAIAVLASLGSLTEITAYAQRAGASQVGGPSLPTDIFGKPIVGSQDDLVKTIVDIAQTIIFIFAAACVLIIIWGGIQWGISGTEDGSKKGQQIIQNGVVGLIIAALAFLFIRIVFGIIQFVLDFFGKGNN